MNYYALYHSWIFGNALENYPPKCTLFQTKLHNKDFVHIPISNKAEK